MSEIKKKFSPKFFETDSNLGKFQIVVHWITSVIESVLILAVITGIVLSMFELPQMLKEIFYDYKNMSVLINYVSLVIIGIELIHVVASQNLESVIEILMMAFTRVLVIRELDITQLLLGVVCIAGLFAIKKYLVVNTKSNP